MFSIFMTRFPTTLTWEVVQCTSASQWNSTSFAFSIIIEGATEKVMQFLMPLKSIYNKNLGFIEQEMYF
jgi:hypothetical protein